MSEAAPRRRRWPWVLFGLVVVVASLPLAVYGLLASERGSAWLLRQAVAAAATQGVEVTLARSQGSLLDRLELHGLRVHAADTLIAADRLLLQWRPRELLGRRLHVELLQLDGLAVTPPPPTGEAPSPLELPEIALPLTVQLDRLLLENTRIVQPESDLVLERLALAATLDEQGLRLAGLELVVDGARLDGDLGMRLSAPHGLDGQLAAQVDERLAGPEVGRVALDATLAGTALRPQFAAQLTLPAALQLQGELRLDQVSPGFALAATWSTLAWPLQGAPTARAGAGELHLDGVADDYRLTLDTRLELTDLPPAAVSLAAQGDLRGMRLAPLTLRVGEGQLQVEGTLGWEGQLGWQLALRGERIDPALFAADWPGEIGGRVTVDGALGEGGVDGLRVAARIHELSGRLRGYPVSAGGALDWRTGRLRAEALRLASGPNRVDLDGVAGEALDLAFAIEAPDLASLYPGLGGRLSGSGRLAGTPAQPAVKADLKGAALVFDTLRAQTLQLSADWQAQGGTGSVRLSGVDAAGTVLDSVDIGLAGTPEAHRVDLAAQGPQGSVTLGAQGGLSGEVWNGRVQDLRLQAPGLGDWRLGAPATLRLAAAEASSGPLCLVRPPAEVCVRGGWERVAGLDLNATLRGLDLAELGPHLPGEALVEGQLAGEIGVSGQPDRPRLRFALRPSDGRVRLEEAAQPIDVAFRNARIEGQFADDRGSADLRLEIGPNGSAAGRITLGPAAVAGRRLGGELRADFPDLGLVAGFVPALDEVQGRLQVEASLGGTLDTPQLLGGVEVSDARARVPAAGILLSDIALQLQGSGDAPLRLSGQARSGDGRITLDGTIDPAARGGPAVDLAIRGENFEAARLPEALVLVSPRLDLRGNGPYRLTGTLRIPRAAIELKDLPKGTVSVSDDEIIVGDTPPEPKRAAPANLEARVRVELGDAVSFKGFGLSTGLRGALDASVDHRGTAVDGKIELHEGRYQAYGQDLVVDRGRLLFAGPPGNPDVDLRALRVSRDGQVKAYLAMSGPLSKPRPRVYSEPTLPEAEAIAYLLTGRGLDAAGQQEGADIAGAALSLGLSRGEPLLQKLSDRVGLDELRIESGANGIEDSSLLVGKYLNPDLYLGYSQGLFNPEGAVLLRLRLSEQLEVESRSGSAQSVDLFYRIEHD